MQPVPASIRALFPRRGNHEIVVHAAVRWQSSRNREPSVPEWTEWTFVDEPATRTLLEQLHADGFSHVRVRNVGITPAVREVRSPTCCKQADGLPPPP